MKVKPFENVRDQFGFCGIWCGSCSAGNGAIVELTRRYEEIVKKNKLEKWAPKDFDFGEFMKGLASIQKVPLCPGCLKGGGNPTCEVRTCALEKNLPSCSFCDQLRKPSNFQSLEKALPNIREDLIKIKNVALQELIEKYISELKGKFPHCILFCSAL